MKQARIVVVTALLWLVAVGFNYYAEIKTMSEQPAGTDFYKFHLSARSLLAGETPYWRAPLRYNPASHCYIADNPTLKPASSQKMLDNLHPGHRECLNPNLNPPIFIVLTAPLGMVDFVPGWWLWSSLSLIAGIIGLYVVVDEKVLGTSGGRGWYMLLAVPAMLTYYPVMANIQYGQIGLFLLLLMALAWRDLRHGKDIRAGMILGVAASLKLFIGLFVLALLVDRRWKASGAFIAVCGVMALVGFIFLSAAGYRDYQVALTEVTWYATNWNASLTGLFYRLLGGADTPGLFAMPGLAAVMTGISSLIILAVTLAVIHKINILHSDSVMIRSDVLFAIVLIAMLLLSPLGWMYYFPVLIISLAVSWHYCGAMSLRNIPLFGGLVFVILTFLPFGLLKTDKFMGGVEWWWSGAIYSYALLILFATVIFCAIKISRGTIQLPHSSNV